MTTPDLIRRLREMSAEAERLGEGDGQTKNYPRALGHMLGSVDALILTLESEPSEPEAKCAGCGQFLSAVRVQMRIERCARCDGHGARRRR